MPEGGIHPHRVDLAPGVVWICLESSFDLTAAPPPDARLFFQFLYGLWPTTVLTFLRRPILYLKNSGLASPFRDDWDEVIDVDEVHSKATPILRSHILHPSIILRDSAAELSDFTRWSTEGMDVPGLVSQCISLDVRYAAATLPGKSRHHQTDTSALVDFGIPKGLISSSREALGRVERVQSHQTEATVTSVDAHPAGDLGAAVEQPAPPGSSPPIQELVATHVALKSSNIVAESAYNDSDPGHLSPRMHYQSHLIDDSASPSHPPTPLSPGPHPLSPSLVPSSLPVTPPMGPSPRLRFKPLGTFGNDLNEAHTVEVISSLQREVALLRNELNFELWLKKQHLSHMGKLHRDRIIARSEEAERQNLHIKLKQKTKMLQQAQDELKALKVEAAAAKIKQNEWVDFLQNKLTKHREEKKSWNSEATELRGEVIEAKAMVAKQRAIMDETDTEHVLFAVCATWVLINLAIRRFNLQNQLNEIKPKIEKIHDYERKIEEMTKRQMMWDDSFEMREYREQKAQMDLLLSKQGKMELTIQSLEAANEALEELNNEQRKTMRSMEQHRAISPTGTRAHRSSSISSHGGITVSHSKYLALETEHLTVRSQNRELEEKVEELEMMVEVLRLELAKGGRRGSVHTQRSFLPPELGSPSSFGAPS